MRKIIICMALLLSATLANAQESKDNNFEKRLFEAKLAEMCLTLELTDAQKEKFAPVFEQYDKEMRALIGEKGGMRPGTKPHDKAMGKKPGKEKAKDAKASKEKPEAAGEKKQMDDAERVQVMKKHMEMQQKVQQIRLDYTDKFAKVLTDKQLLRFYEVEQDIQKKLRDRARGMGRPEEPRRGGAHPNGPRPRYERPVMPRTSEKR